MHNVDDILKECPPHNLVQGYILLGTGFASAMIKVRVSIICT